MSQYPIVEFQYPGDGKRFNQELRLAGGSTLRYLIGLYYLRTRGTVRQNIVFGPGATNFFLGLTSQYQPNSQLLHSYASYSDIHDDGIRGIIVARRTPEDNVRRRSFELLRGVMTGVVVITFDELLARLKEIHATARDEPLRQTSAFRTRSLSDISVCALQACPIFDAYRHPQKRAA